MTHTVVQIPALINVTIPAHFTEEQRASFVAALFDSEDHFFVEGSKAPVIAENIKIAVSMVDSTYTDFVHSASLIIPDRFNCQKQIEECSKGYPVIINDRTMSFDTNIPF
ncbi:hypothetical protein [Vibrio alginolyticus]|uniref:hypothetical protein n=1 Tax=Vibrio alginolyticus TaxID=663 RepID=UPI0006CA9DD0|nr:hypothetical protein [Vibrio alginolyticus]KPM98382.1 hypothetical protein AOG25_08015 [Vibrio alginolyticus]